MIHPRLECAGNSTDMLILGFIHDVQGSPCHGNVYIIVTHPWIVDAMPCTQWTDARKALGGGHQHGLAAQVREVGMLRPIMATKDQQMQPPHKVPSTRVDCTGVLGLLEK